VVDHTVEIRGERLVLMPERALYWERMKTLFVADMHLGKVATFRAYAIPLPEGNTAADLERLTRLVERSGARRLVILGDLLHAAKGRSEQTLTTVARWRSQHPNLDMLLVRGNHDRGAGDPPDDWRIDCVDAPAPEFPFVLSHVPIMPDDSYGLAGHLHPAARLLGKGRQIMMLPCFWFGKSCAVLPAFGSFTGNAVIQPQPGDRVFVIAEDRVLAV
jgi:DNA ligase-associated metallophosphoesterase